MNSSDFGDEIRYAVPFLGQKNMTKQPVVLASKQPSSKLDQSDLNLQRLGSLLPASMRGNTNCFDTKLFCCNWTSSVQSLFFSLAFPQTYNRSWKGHKTMGTATCVLGFIGFILRICAVNSFWCFRPLVAFKKVVGVFSVQQLS